MRARAVVEAANGPTTAEADRILFERDIPVLPDILANAGGVTVSYFEWVQSIENEQWALDRVNQKLRQKMERATEAVIEEQHTLDRGGNGGPDGDGTASRGPVTLRTAALIRAVRRVANVARQRGLWP